jgi:hypothetical protein
MYKAALEYLEYDELPQQQKQVYSQLEQQERLNQSLYQQHQDAMAQLGKIQTQARGAELTQVLASPEIKSVSEKYDSAYGAGSFRQEVINRGKAHYAMTGEDLSAQQIAESLIKMVKPFLPQQQTQAVTPKEVPVIPATGTASSSTPGDKAIRSVADLKRVANDRLKDLRR